jgi:hypothetical protein
MLVGRSRPARSPLNTKTIAALAAAAARAMAGWSYAFRDLVGLVDPTAISCLPIRTRSCRSDPRL